jgi:predicted nucleotidyltransferase
VNWETLVVRAVREETQRIKKLVPTSRWFLFGSITIPERIVSDLDLLVVCKTTADCIKIRGELASLSTQFPIHLLLMTTDEESEVGFIEGEKALEMNQEE